MPTESGKLKVIEKELLEWAHDTIHAMKTDTIAWIGRYTTGFDSDGTNKYAPMLGAKMYTTYVTDSFELKKFKPRKGEPTSSNRLYRDLKYSLLENDVYRSQYRPTVESAINTIRICILHLSTAVELATMQTQMQYHKALRWIAEILETHHTAENKYYFDRSWKQRMALQRAIEALIETDHPKVTLAQTIKSEMESQLEDDGSLTDSTIKQTVEILTKYGYNPDRSWRNPIQMAHECALANYKPWEEMTAEEHTEHLRLMHTLTEVFHSKLTEPEHDLLEIAPEQMTY